MTIAPSGPRVLFVASHRLGRAPNQRFRFEQYLGYLAQQGFGCEVSPLLDAADDAILYQPGRFLSKSLLLARTVARRLRDVRRASSFDVVFVAREAHMTGSTTFESRMRKAGPAMVFDFDDAIWLLDVSSANRRLAFLKNPGKTADLIALSDRVFAGNAYLADYARRFNPSVALIPTTIDTDEYTPRPRPARDRVTIGWSGSITTIRYLDSALPVLRQVKAKYGDRVEFRIVGDGSYRVDDLGIRGVPWRLEDEIDELSRFDIGIMPMPYEEFAKGKCGLKGLQYMALETPAVMTPISVNAEIIADGENGFLAATDEEWVRKLSALVESPALREKLGKAGRATVLERYSVRSQRDRYVSELSALARRRSAA